MPQPTIDVVRHDALTMDDLQQLSDLFHDEYLDEHGPWNPDQPYGYAAHDVHVIARAAGRIVGHVGWARREVDVGGTPVVIAGVGGVLVAGSARGADLGIRMLRAAERSMSEDGSIRFGYLGCREEVVPFYQAGGWTRIVAAERSIGRDGTAVSDAPGQPLLVLPVASAISDWPSGTVDLRGRAW